MAANRVIGLGNDIPWRIPGEQKRFRELTMNQLVVMGRRTFESIGKPLPGRDLLVLSSGAAEFAGARTVNSLAEVTAALGDDPRDVVFVGGGQQVYAMFMPYADCIYLTEIDLHPAGDAFFPELPERFSLVDTVAVPGEIRYAFNTYAVTSPDEGRALGDL
ncbi:dihydrofolate reductase [Burkholderia gladioli]|nr:dihydrofolate reductase [Burkholderia gladioli]